MQTALKRPEWLNKKIDLKQCHELKSIFARLGLNTVCQEANCPNISECFGKKTAAFMILGKSCTRNCGFCNVESSAPEAVSPEEPERVAEAIKHLGLKHALITSVTRDDLADGGSGAFAETIKSVRDKNRKITIEVLIPDFKGDIKAIKVVVDAAPDIINHNIETVPRLYSEIRPQADYRRSLSVLKISKELSSGKKIFTKSGIMLGLGEREDEILTAFHDLRDVECDFLSIGQYLAPSKNHYPVKEYITPEKFKYYKEKALGMGFAYAASAPYVRSSYHAADYMGGTA